MTEKVSRASDDELARINEHSPTYGSFRFLKSAGFGGRLVVNSYRMKNGLDVLLVVDKTAPVISFHAWFKVGSRHEKQHKTGLAHLFEHLMFNEVEGLSAGEFDKKMEAAGADNNASTWLDFTQYQEAFPKEHLKMVLDLEARRMDRLVLRQPQLDSEKVVVKNERLYRVEDDVEGTVDELLWKTAFLEHPYRWPTIGWMKDIEGFTASDCEEFYKTYYAPNNATLILVGHLDEALALKQIGDAYGEIPPSKIPEEVSSPEPTQNDERVVEIRQPTPTEKLTIGYKGPALSDPDHAPLCLLIEVLLGGRASRLRRRLIRTDKVASDASGYVGPHHAPSLIEITSTARDKNTAEVLLQVVDDEIEKIRSTPISNDERDRALARLEFGLLGSLETADGKASTIGFYQTLLGDPSAAFTRMEQMSATTPADLQRLAIKFLSKTQRTVVKVRPSSEGGNP